MLRYRLEGSGVIPLLLIHGWGVTYSIWQNLAPLLTPYFRLIMIELPGIGGSPEADPHKPYYESCAEAINEVRNALGIEQWSLLAYSSGTRAAEAYVRRYPQTVIRAVFLCPIYLQEIWSFFLRLLDTPHPKTFNQWILSDWRLYNLICGLGFNWHRHDYTYIWQNEIELQPVNILVRSLCEIPGKGRAPFDLPAVPTLFVWGRRDALTAKPRRPRPNDVLIPADHSAPMLAAAEVAAAVLPFLTTGELQTQESSVVPATGQGRVGKETSPFLSLRSSSPHAVWRIWRTVFYKRKKQPTRSRKEARLMKRLLRYPQTDRRNEANLTSLPTSPDAGHSNRTIPNRSSGFALGTNRTGNLNETDEARGATKRHRLLGQRKEGVQSTTHTPKKRFLRNSSDSGDPTSEKRLFFRRPNRAEVPVRGKNKTRRDRPEM
jgi:pimeloyl-ACP methyl ester carboxylesterase